MTVIARLDITPLGEESMTDAIASAVEALDDHDVTYEVTPTDTVIEGEDLHAVYGAAAAAHEAVDGSRAVASLQVDDQAGRERRADDRVDAVEEVLGRPPKSEA